MTDANQLIEFLRDRDVPCPQCEYNPRGLTSSRCPECGQGVQLAVTLVEPYLKAWISLLVAMCAGAGIGVLWIVVIASQGLPNETPLIFTIFFQILMIPIVPVLVLKRRRFLKLSRDKQWKWVVFGASMFAISIVLVVKSL